MAVHPEPGPRAEEHTQGRAVSALGAPLKPL